MYNGDVSRNTAQKVLLYLHNIHKRVIFVTYKFKNYFIHKWEIVANDTFCSFMIGKENWITPFLPGFIVV